MQSINQEREVFLGVLLVIAVKLFTAACHRVLKRPWDDRGSRIPHAFYEIAKLEGKLPLEAERISHVELLHVHLLKNKVVVEDF